MNYNTDERSSDISPYQLDQFQRLVSRLYQCCQERMQYQSDRFDLPDAELRCLLLFGEERYLTPKGIAQKMNVVKSRISKIIDGLSKKGYVQRIKDPEDSRVHLLSLSSEGHKKLADIKAFMDDVHQQVLSRIPPEQRKIMLIDLELLKSSMEAVKDMME
ncbi:MAG: MarR family transcriptional regulator [Desulfobacterales bacterium]